MAELYHEHDSDKVTDKEEPEQEVERASSNLSYLEKEQQLQQKKDEEPEEDDKRRTNDKEKNKLVAKKQLQVPQTLPLAVAKKQKSFDLNDASTQGIFLYKPGVQLPNLFPFMQQTIKIIIASEYITKTNPEYIRRNIYGSEAYTSNSDAVCIAVHSEKLNINTFNHRKYEGIELTCKITRPKKTYIGNVKNGLSSRSIKGYDGNALKPESVKNLTSLGPLELLEKYAANMHIPIGTKRIKAKPRNINSVIPIPETHIVFNMNNEPAYKYSLFNIADRGFEKSEWVVKRLDSSVLYLEGEDTKYELLKRNRSGNSGPEKEFFELFKFSIVKNPEKIDNEYMSKSPPPLAEEMVEVVYPELQWEEILWGNNSIQVKDKNFTGIRSFKYYKTDAKQQRG